MTISPNPGGSVLYFSRQELTDRALTPERLTDHQCMGLIRSALAGQDRAIPLDLEVESFPTRQGILVFVQPRMTEAAHSHRFSVTFS